jgi:hypothetical protein
VGGRCGHRFGQSAISQILLTKILINLLAPPPEQTRRSVSVELGDMHPKSKIVLILSVCTPLLSGCFDSNNTRSLEQHTADATAAAKRDAGAIARGVVEGLTRKGPTDINTASAQDLEKLPDVTAAEAQAIIAGRPYENTSQLVKKHIFSKAQYNKIQAQIGVK